MNIYTNLVQCWVSGSTCNANLALWLNSAAQADVEALVSERIISNGPFITVKGPMTERVIEFLSTKYKDIAVFNRRAIEAGISRMLMIEEHSFNKWLRDSHIEHVANNAVDVLLGEAEAEEFMSQFDKSWHGDIVQDGGHWFMVQWYRGVDKIGAEPEQLYSREQKEWLERYANWLDARYPFDVWANSSKFTFFGSHPDAVPAVGDWMEDAKAKGWLKKYRRTPGGKYLPAAPVPVP